MGGSRIKLLDTCALLWLVHDQKKISRPTLERINEEPVVYVSAISGFEIGLKCQAGKLKLPVPPLEWIERIVEHHHLSLIGLDFDICVKATELPPIHKDPCDRFLIATAILNRLPIVTADTRFEAYGVTVLM